MSKIFRVLIGVCAVKILFGYRSCSNLNIISHTNQQLQNQPLMVSRHQSNHRPRIDFVVKAGDFSKSFNDQPKTRLIASIFRFVFTHNVEDVVCLRNSRSGFRDAIKFLVSALKSLKFVFKHDRLLSMYLLLTDKINETSTEWLHPSIN